MKVSDYVNLGLIFIYINIYIYVFTPAACVSSTFLRFSWLYSFVLVLRAEKKEEASDC